MREFKKKKLNKPTSGGSELSFDEIDSVQLEDGSTESLLDEIDMLLDASLMPIEIIEKKKEKVKEAERIERQKARKSSDGCTCF